VTRVRFLGRSTGGSLIHRVFPAWTALLRLDVTLEGVDLPADAGAAAYRQFVEDVRDDPEVLGAVITSHKLGVHAAARDLLTPADPYVDRLGEVNAIAAEGMTAHARDVLAVTAMLPAFGPVREALVLGAGGAGTAIVLALLPRDVRIVVTDTRPDRLAALQRALGAEAARVTLAPATESDARLAELRPGALVVNATGLGKDAPASPVTGRFPPGAVVWDTNYRGALEFLAAARAQGGLRVFDGWDYFVHGWAEALAPILDVPLDRAALAAAAAAVR
jgi:shikimate dehydrogenase